MMQSKLVIAVCVLIVCVFAASNTHAFKPASRLFPMQVSEEQAISLLEVAGSDDTLFHAEEIARALGAEVTSLKGEEQPLPQENAEFGSVDLDAHIKSASSASSFIENEKVNNKVESINTVTNEDSSMVEQSSSSTNKLEDKIIEEELKDKVDYREFLPGKVASLIDDVEDQLHAPIPELKFPELNDVNSVLLEVDTSISNQKSTVQQQIESKLQQQQQAQQKPFQVVGNDKQPYARLDVEKGGFSQRHINKARGVDVYVVNDFDREELNEVRPVPPPHPHVYPPYNMRIVPHSPPRPDERVNPTTQLNTLSIYEASLEGPEFHGSKSKSSAFPTNSAAAAFLALEASEPPAARKVVAGGGAAPQFDSNGNYIPQGSRPPVMRGLFPGSGPTINSIPFNYRGNYENGFNSLSPRYPAKLPVAPARDGPAVKLDELLPLKADIVEDLSVFNQPPQQEADPKFD